MVQPQEQTHAFFDELFAGKPERHTVVLWAKNGSAKRTTYSLGADSATRDALGAEGDVYAGVCYAGPGVGAKLGPKRRPGLAHVSAMTGVWCDLDVNGGPENKTGGASSRQVALDLVDRLPLRPTLLVDSGYGVQPWWLFDTPLVFDGPQDRSKAADLVVRWYAWLRDHARALEPSFGIDATHDLSRVLRVPGTFNLKGGHRAPVQLLEHHAQRYPADAIAQLVEDIVISPTLFSLSGNGSGHPGGSIHADEVVIEVCAEAQPPFDKWDALRDLDPRVGQSWARTRADAKNWSASEYDHSLANFALEAGWTDQETADLLVAARRRHGDDLKRPAYYATTIAKIRADRAVREVDAVRTEALAVLTEPAVTGVEDRDEVLRAFSAVIGLEVRDWRQYGRDPDTGGEFAMQLADGYELALGGADVVTSPARFGQRVYTVTGHMPAEIKKAEWRVILNRLGRIRHLVDSPDEGIEARLERWLDTYLADTLTADKAEAARTAYPFQEDGRLFVVLESFRTWLRTRYAERLDESRLQGVLKRAGFRPEKVSYRKPGGQTSSRHYYARSLRRLEVVA